MLFRCVPSSATSAPEYTHVWPRRAQKEQTGFSPGHLVFFRLARNQKRTLVSKQETTVLTDNHRKLVWLASLAVRLLWAPFWSRAQAGSTEQFRDKWSIALVYSLDSGSDYQIHVDSYLEMTSIGQDRMEKWCGDGSGSATPGRTKQSGITTTCTCSS